MHDRNGGTQKMSFQVSLNPTLFRINFASKRKKNSEFISAIIFQLEKGETPTFQKVGPQVVVHFSVVKMFFLMQGVYKPKRLRSEQYQRVSFLVGDQKHRDQF